MAIARVGGSTGTGNKTAQASVGIAPAATYPVGTLVIAQIAADNAGTSGASAISSVSDNQGNTWTQRALVNRTAGSAANDGLTVAIFTSRLTKQLTTSDTITFNFSPNVTAKAYGVQAYSGACGKPFDSGTNSGSGATNTVGPSASLANGDLISAIAGNESVTSPTSDGDSTGGTWGGNFVNSGGSGGDATKMAAVVVADKIVNASGTQTFNGNNGATTDWASAYVAHTVADDKTVTPGVLAIATTGPAPTVTATNNVRVTPPTAALVLAPFVPQARAPQLVTPATLALATSVAAQARDAFERTESSTWGTADQGGAWAGSGASLSVGSGTARMTLNASGNVRPTLNAVALRDQDVVVNVKADKLAVGDVRTESLILRFVDGSNFYRAEAVFNTDGTIDARIQSTVGGSTTSLVTAASGVTDAAATWYRMRAQAIGASPTTLRFKIWPSGSVEPAWQVTTTDSSAALQVADGVGTRGALGASTSNGPVLIEWDEFQTIGYAPSVVIGRFATPPQASLSTSVFAPTVSTPRLVTPPVKTLALTAFAPTVQTPRLVTPPKLAIVTAAFAPDVTATASDDQVATPGTASLVLSPLAPTVTAPRLVTPAKVSLTLSPFTPTVQAPRLATPGKLSLTTSTFAPRLALQVTIPTKALTLSTFVPAARVPRLATPPTLPLSLTAFAPGVTGGAGLTVTPGKRSLVTSSFAPTVTAPQTPTPGTVALTLTAFAPQAATPRLATPGVVALSTATFAPALRLDIRPSPATRALVTSPFAPSIALPRTSTPPTLGLALTRYAPNVVIPGDVVPAAAALQLTPYAPQAGVSLDVVPGPLGLTLTGLGPTVRRSPWPSRGGSTLEGGGGHGAFSSASGRGQLSSSGGRRGGLA